jgi:hypothetical protein
MLEERCCARATHQEFPDEIPPHKVIEYGYSLEYTREKQGFRTITSWMKETRRQRSEEQREWSASIPPSWRNRDARPRDNVFGVQFSVHIY